MVPSLDVVIPRQFFDAPVLSHVAPKSVDIQIVVPSTAASLVPSLDDAMSIQLFVLPTDDKVQAACVETRVENESRAASTTLNTLRRGISYLCLVFCEEEEMILGIA